MATHEPPDDDVTVKRPASRPLGRSGAQPATRSSWYKSFATTVTFPVDELLRMPPPDVDPDQQVADTPTWVLDITDKQRAILKPAFAARTEAREDDLAPTVKRNALVTGAEGYIGLIRNLAQSSGAYVLASLTAPLIAIVLAPFLTHHLSRTDYGALTILNTAIGLGAGLSQLGMASAFFRAFNYDYSTARDRHAVISTSLMILALASGALFAALYFNAASIAQVLLGQASYASEVQVTAGIICLQNLTVPGFAWLRAENKALTFSLLSIINLALALAANFEFVGADQLGVRGALLATGVGYGSVALATIPILLWSAGVRWRWDVARNLLGFGVPLVMNFAASWILQLSDRYLLSVFSSLAEAGAYSIAYMIGSVIAVVLITPFQLAWPATMFTIAKRHDAKRIFALIFRWFSLALLLAAFALTLVGLFAFRLLFPPSYQYASPVIPVVALSLVCNGLYIIFTTGISVQRRNWLAVIYTSVAAVTNIGLNIALIPMLGIMGAAIATLVAYAVMATFAYIVNQRSYPIPFEVGKFAAGLLVSAILFCGATWLNLHAASFALPAWSYWPVYVTAFVMDLGCLAVLLSQRAMAVTSESEKSLAFSRATSAQRVTP